MQVILIQNQTPNTTLNNLGLSYPMKESTSSNTIIPLACLFCLGGANTVKKYPVSDILMSLQPIIHSDLAQKQSPIANILQHVAKLIRDWKYLFRGPDVIQQHLQKAGLEAQTNRLKHVRVRPE